MNEINWPRFWHKLGAWSGWTNNYRCNATDTAPFNTTEGAD